MEIELSFLGVFQISFSFLIIYAIALLWKNKKLSTVFFNLSFGLYLILLINVCFFPMKFISWKDWEALSMATQNNNFIPFKTITEGISAVLHGEYYQAKVFFGNLLMLTPLGVFFTVKYTALKERLIKVCLVAVLIETLQYTIGLFLNYNYRSVDIDDFILNALGGIISCLICHWLYKKWQHKYNKNISEVFDNQESA